jgi:2-phosphosulfolactate phosphatase
MKRLHVWLTKEEIVPERLVGAAAVVIDVLLATTTMVTMMERGAQRVFPVGSLEEARRLRRELASPNLITGGEEDGFKVEEFDLGPLPDEFTEEVVRGKDIIFLTTNGTRAVRYAQPAGQLLLGCLRNAPAVADYLNRAAVEDVFIICAGSKGHFSYEDFLCASEIVSRLDLTGVKMNDAAQFAYDSAQNRPGEVFDALRRGRVGRYFMENGLRELLQFVGSVGDASTVVEVKDGQLRLLLESRC